jgi:hypothetical protein
LFSNNKPKIPESEKIRRSLLRPKESGLTGILKPQVLILNSPFDSIEDKAVQFQETKKRLEGSGYTVINKSTIIYNLNTEEFKAAINDENYLKSLIAPMYLADQKPMVIWLEAHSAPGWLFGPGTTTKQPEDRPSLKKEAAATVGFCEYLLTIEEKCNKKISSIVLSSCYSGCEFVYQDQGAYLLSPARTLSILMHGKPVFGTYGTYSGPVVTDLSVWADTNNKSKDLLIYDDQGGKLSEPTGIPILEASVIFQNGKSIESSDKAIYWGLKHLPLFIKTACKINFQEEDTPFFRICPSLEEVEKLRKEKKFKEQGLIEKSNCLGDVQLNRFNAFAQEIAEKRAPKKTESQEEKAEEKIEEKREEKIEDKTEDNSMKKPGY